MLKAEARNLSASIPPAPATFHLELPHVKFAASFESPLPLNIATCG
jgi:hypothetical protein